jgi:phenylacetate-CoA ligase
LLAAGQGAQQAGRQSRAIGAAMRNERLAPAAVRELQDRKLRAMVRHAWSASPFYRQKLRAAGITPDDIQTQDDLVKLPVTTKQELREAGPERVLAQGYSAANTIFEATSGSSGTMLPVYHTPEAYDTYFAYAFRHLWDLGYRPWHRVAYTAFEPLQPLPWEKLGLARRAQVDLSQRDPRHYVDTLLRVRPQIITAYPSILQMVIGAATAAELARIRPRAIHLHSELLTEGMRDAIRQAFACDCFDDYSTVEFHHVAYECRRHRYHLAADNVIAEFVRDGHPVGPGEEGEILLTGLTNRAMPLLRYAIGDVGVAGGGPEDEPCPCGRGFPTMRLITGRVDDFLLLPDGRRISPRMVNPAIEFRPGLLGHVLVQEAVDRVVVHMHVTPPYRETTPAAVRQAVRQILGETVDVTVRLDEHIKRGRTGKLRCIVSKVAA